MSIIEYVSIISALIGAFSLGYILGIRDKKNDRQ